MSIYPWLKAIFRKLQRCGCFPGNFSWAALPSESYTWSRLLWIELCTVILFHCYTDFFLCSLEQRDYYSSRLYSGMQKLFRIDRLPFSSDGKLCCSPLFLTNCEILEKIPTKICETLSKEEATVGQRTALWNWVTHVKISKFAVFTKIFLKSSGRYYSFFGKYCTFSLPTQLDFIKWLFTIPIHFTKIPTTIARSSRPEVFCRKGVLRNFTKQNSQENTCARVSFLIKLGLRPATWLKETDTGVLLWILRNF